MSYFDVNPRCHTQAVCALFIAALTLRLGMVFMAPVIPASDARDYDRLGISIAGGAGFSDESGKPTSFRPPAYPYLLAATYLIFGHTYIPVWIVQCLLGSLTVVFLIGLGERIFSRTIGLSAGALAAFYPSYVSMPRFLLTETVFTFLLAAFVYGMVACLSRITAIRMTGLGVVSGLLILTRPSAMLLPAVFSIVILAKQRRSFRTAVTPLLSLIAGASLVVIPWTARNWEIHRRVVLVSTNGGLNLYQAFNPEESKKFGFVPRDPVISEAATIQNEADRDSFLTRGALFSIVHDPIRSLRLTVMRVLLYWGFFDWEFQDGRTFNGLFAFLMPFAVIGAVRGSVNSEGVLIVAIVIAGFALTVLFSQGAVRYRLPTDGLMFVLASRGFWWTCIEKKRERVMYVCIATFGAINAALSLIPGMAKVILRDAAHALGLW